jgi:adenylosuccinate lyase
VRANVQPGMENIALWHERDISHSSVERVILPDSSILVDYMLHRMDGILAGLLVYPQRMLENMDRLRGLTFSGVVLLGLVRTGLTRDEAYIMVQRNAMKVWEEKGSLRDLLAADEEVASRLSHEDLDRLFDLNYQLRHVDQIYERVLGERPAQA